MNITRDGPFEVCNNRVPLMLSTQHQKNTGYHLKNVLNKGIPVLVYNGDKDYMNNWIGAEAWTNALVWDHQKSFNKQKYQKWGVSTGNTTTVYGEFKQQGNFTFLKVFDAGQMVAHD